METREELINLLSQLYRLRDEGKKVNSLILEVEQKLYELVESEEEE